MILKSQSGQDYFAWWMTGFVPDGFFIDIGCNHPIDLNNSYLLENVGWNGISIDHQDRWNYCSARKTPLIIADATTVDLRQIFSENNVPKVIDFLSLDIDAYCLEALKNFPLSDYECKVIAIEHDLYLRGDTLRASEREILQSHGYTLVCADIHVDFFPKDDKPYEDWWVKEEYVDPQKIMLVKSERLYPSQILARTGFSGTVKNWCTGDWDDSIQRW
jgi:hypothetical protein